MGSEIESLLKQQKTRTTIMGVMIGVLLVVCVGLYFFGLIKSVEAEKNYSEANQVKEKLDKCVMEAQSQRRMAEQAAEKARRAQQMAERAEEMAKEAAQKALKK